MRDCRGRGSRHARAPIQIVAPALLLAATGFVGHAAAADPRPTHADIGLGGHGPLRPSRWSEGPRLEASRFWSREAALPHGEPGFEVAFGAVSHVLVRPAFLHGTWSAGLRFLDSDAYSLALGRHVVVAGVVVGPLDAFAGPGFTLFDVDRVHGKWGFGMFSPRATAGVGVRVGRMRIELSAYEEYLWRWTQHDFTIRGFLLGISRDRPPMWPAGSPPPAQ